MVRKFSEESKKDQLDEQAEKTLEGLREMSNFLQDDFVRGIIRIDENVEDNLAYNDLISQIQSLQQFVAREKSLIYIGFMGHFSTGKSTTINSLLGLDGEERRDSNNHPTDKVITLITHPENEIHFPKFFPFHNIGIKVETVENDFLKNCVFVDTPGSGDTDKNLMKAMMEDFLPICDLILYFINAASPLDRNDLPVLSAKQSSLDLIPMKYVVIRANEFQKNPDEKLTQENYQQGKADKFVATTLDRIREVLPDASETSKDFFLIDNPTSFGINGLRNFLFRFSDEEDTQQRLKVHQHKVDWYLRKSEQLKTKFLGLLSESLQKVDEFLEGAEDQKKAYENEVRISNRNLELSWERTQKELGEVLNKLKEKIDPAYDNEVPEEIWEGKVFERGAESLGNARTFLRKEEHNRILRKVLTERESQLANFLKQKMGWESLDEESVDFIPGSFSKEFRFERKKSFLLLHQTAFKTLLADLKAELEGFLNDLDQTLKSHHGRLNAKLPESEFLPIVRKKIDEFESDMRLHFRHVEMYQQTVFSKPARRYVTPLGLDETLESKKEEFGEAYKETSLKKAHDSIFNGIEDRRSEFHSKIQALSQEYSSMRQDLKTLKNEDIPLKDTSTDNLHLIEIDDYLSEINSVFQTRALRLLEELRQEGKQRKAAHREFVAAKEEVLRKTKKQGMLILSLSGFILPLCILGMIFMPESIAWLKWILPFIAIVAGGFLAMKFLKLRQQSDAEGEALSEAEDSVREDWNKNLMAGLENFGDTIRTNTDLQDKTLEFEELVVSKQVEVFKKSPFGQKAAEIYQAFRALHEKELNLREDYLRAADELFEVYREYFEFDGETRQKFQAISDEIKDYAIQPSFEFLQKCKADYDKYVGKMKSIALQ